MIVEKVLNNNVVVSIDPKTKKEVILMGSGIAFNKKPGQQIDEKKIEKTFVVDDENLGNKIKKLINQIPEGIFEITDEIITYAIVELNVELDKQIYISLADHIAFAIKRYKNGIIIKNELLSEIRRIHKAEYNVSLWAVDYINKKVNIELPEDEAGFIALHFVNAQDSEGKNDGFKISHIVNEIMEIVKRYYDSIVFDEESLYYQRFITHLKYFAQRFLHKELNYKEDTNLFEIIRNQYKEAYGCVKLIYLMMDDKYNYKLTEEEMLYLTMHIQSITEKSTL